MDESIVEQQPLHDIVRGLTTGGNIATGNGLQAFTAWKVP